MSGPHSIWHVAENSAALTCGPLAGSVALHDRGAGFLIEQWLGQAVGGSGGAAFTALRYLGPHFPTETPQLAETYARGGDLVLTFAESGRERVAPQLYWRAAELPAVNGAKIELLVSVRTDLLDSQPLSRVTSRLPVGARIWHTSSLHRTPLVEVPAATSPQLAEPLPTIHFDAAQSSEHLFVVRCSQLGLSYAEMVHPSDFVSAEVALDMKSSPLSLTTKLFPERLEKGVIRRGRICGWFLPCQHDLETAVALARQFVAEPLPLTA